MGAIFLDAGTPAILMIIPDANTLLCRRLKGVGASAGVQVEIFTSLSELPAHPPCPSLLVVAPGLHRILKKIDRTIWLDIFEVTRPQSNESLIQQTKSTEGKQAQPFSTINLVGPKDAQIQWHTLLSYLFHVIAVRRSASPSPIAWQVAQANGQGPMSKALAAFSRWTTQFKISQVPAIKQFKAILEKEVDSDPATASWHFQTDGLMAHLWILLANDHHAFHIQDAEVVFRTNGDRQQSFGMLFNLMTTPTLAFEIHDRACHQMSFQMNDLKREAS